MPRAQIGFQSNRKRGFLNPFVKLKKMRMTSANTDPNYFGRAFGRKGPDTFDWQEERAKLNRLEFFAQRKIDFLRYVGKKAQGEVHLIACGPTHAANARIKIDQNFSD